ncbi:hypothetical protein H3N56_03870 [Cetobacterium sp. 2A]|nr:hypothetical protein [Cetobacterium sp. 2A]MBC2855279.1 hypothetical protein [Cetobacterium sp. 2A]MBC2855635.1 hypothetical protein [Cetobacterium sp. 2A]
MTSYGFEIIIERTGNICILSVSSYTPTQNSGGIYGLPTWAIALTKGCGALTGDGVPLATGEMYVSESEFSWFVNDISRPALYTGQIIYIAKY